MGRKSKKPRNPPRSNAAAKRVAAIAEKFKTREGSEEVARALLNESAMDETQSYLQRGRPYAGLDIEALNKTWLAALRAFLNNPENQQAYKDADAEFALRKLEPPYAEAKAEIEALVTKAKAIVADPQARARIRASVATTMKK